MAGLLTQITAPPMFSLQIRLRSQRYDVQLLGLAGKPGKEVFISREHAYHGSTIAAASLGGMKPMHEQGHLPIPGISHIAAPYWYRDGADMSPEEFGTACARLLEKEINALGAEPPLSANRSSAPED